MEAKGLYRLPLPPNLEPISQPLTVSPKCENTYTDIPWAKAKLAQPGQGDMRVIYNYAAEDDDELTLNPGDIITNVTQVNEGWSTGRLHGKNGLFPSNFTTDVRDTDGECSPTLEVPVAENNIQLEAAISVSVSDAPPALPARAPLKQRETTASTDEGIYGNMGNSSRQAFIHSYPEFQDTFQAMDGKELQILDKYMVFGILMTQIGEAIYTGRFYDTIRVRYIESSGSFVQALAKVIKPSDETTDHKHFLTDAYMSVTLKHENLLRGLLIARFDGRICLVTSPMHESLDVYLKNDGQSKERKQLLSLQLQAARGLNHIHDLHFAIGRLSTTTTLVSRDDKLKLADFSYTVDANAGNDEDTEKYEWMPPEKLTGRKMQCPMRSDMWDFATFSWRIMNPGKELTQDLSDTHEIYADLRSGMRPPKPNMCSQEDYDLMNDGWEHDPEKRPSSTDFVQRLEQLHRRADYSYVELSSFHVKSSRSTDQSLHLADEPFYTRRVRKPEPTDQQTDNVYDL